ncbi:MAG: HAMP domain-containing sensor histidine kinase, partial [Vallitaleaceae bacterium]|nr:HAMP domain-containing sensor histidine kinase [Vallitaleaceae bacterium]
YIRIISDDFLSTYSTNYQIEITTAEGKAVNIFASDEILYDSEAVFSGIKFGDSVTISGYWLDETTLCPRVINNKIVGNEFYSVYSDLFDSTNYAAQRGEITQLYFPKRASGELYKSNMAWRILRGEVESTFIRGDYQLYKLDDTQTGIVNYMIRKTYTPYDVIAIVSIPQNNDVDVYISNYMQFAIILGAVAIVIFSLILSRLISKPLTRINDSARRIAELDFSLKIPVTSKDELGLLATYLNTLAVELESTLTDLNTANNELKVKLWHQKELEDMRKQFIADVSHEVKTPLGIIQGYAERVVMQLIEAKDNKDYVIDCASIIIEEAKKMNSLINNMNELSRLESPAYQLIKTHFELRELVIDMLEAFDVFLDEKNYTINRDFDELKCYILGDQAKIEQVIVNFLSNVIRYTPTDGIVNITIAHRKSKIYFSI